jgi:hypothetical protein
MNPHQTQRIPLPFHKPVRAGDSSRSFWRRHQPVFMAALMVLIAFAAAALLTGCTAMGAYRPIVPQLATNQVLTPILDPIERIEWRTNVVTVTNVLPGERLVVTNVVTTTPVIVVTNEVHWVTNQVVTTNAFVVSPEFRAALETGRRVNSAVNPTPSAPFVDWGITAVGAIATAVAAWQTRKAQGSGRIADTLIKAVETYPGREGAAVKEHISRVSALTGVADALDDRVQSVTESIDAALADGRLDANEIYQLAKDRRVSEADVPTRYHEAFRALRGQLPA